MNIMDTVTAMSPPTSLRHTHGHGRQGQRGVVALEFAMVFLLGLLPLLLLTFSGVLIFAAKQSLTLAAANGARAALHYGTDAQRQNYACLAAQNSMQWLITYAGDGTSSCTATSTPVSVTLPMACPSSSSDDVKCITVTTSFDYNAHPFLPGTATLYSWFVKDSAGNKTSLSSTAIIQVDTNQIDTQGS